MSTGAVPCTESTHLTVLADRTSMVGGIPRVANAEDRLVSKLRSGEEEAFDAIVGEQHGGLIRMAMRYVVNREAAEEVVQETWMAVMSGLNRFEGRSSLHAWICGILIHKAKDRGVREKRQRTFSGFELKSDSWSGELDPSRFRPRREWPGPTAFSQHLWDDRTPEKLLASRQAIACMRHAIEALPTLQKEVLILRDVHGVETKEICNRLNISETNFYVRLHRARERVRVAVETALG